MKSKATGECDRQRRPSRARRLSFAFAMLLACSFVAFGGILIGGLAGLRYQRWRVEHTA